MAISGALSELKDAENAERAFRQAAALAPDDPVVMLDDVIGLLGVDRRQEAKEVFGRLEGLLRDATVPKEVIWERAIRGLKFGF